MLMIDKSIVIPEVPGVAVYGDDQAISTFYVIPDGPRFRIEDGLPVFKFLKYRVPIDRQNGKRGGGYVFFDVTFDVPPEKMEAVKQALQQQINEKFARMSALQRMALGNQAPPVTIGTIPWLRGTASLTMKEGDGTMIQKIWSPGKPSLFGRNIATFAMELSDFGATLFEQALQGKGGVVSVNYDLFTYTKLPPIKVNGRFFSEKFYSFFQDIDVEWNFWAEDSYQETIREQSRDSSSYTLNFDWGGMTDEKVKNQIRDWATRTMEDNIEKKMIEAIAPVSADDRKAPDGIEDVTRDISNTKIASFDLNFKEGITMEWNPAPQGIMPNITNLKGPDGKPLVWTDFAEEVDLDDPFFKTLNVTMQVNADFAKLPIHSVELHLEYPKTNGKEIGEFRFNKADETQKFECFIDNNNWKYKYFYEVNYKGASKTFKSPLIETDEKVLTVNLDDLGFLHVQIQPGDLNFEQVKQVQVTMEYEDSANGVDLFEQQFTLDKDHKTHNFDKLIFAAKKNPYKYRLKYFMQDGKEYQVKEAEGRSPYLFINDPFAATKTVGVRAMGNLDTDIDTIFVDLKYNDETNKYSQTKTVALSKASPFFDWSFPVIDELAGKITYSGNIKFKNGMIENIAEVTTDKNTLMIGKKIEDVLEIQIVPDLLDFTVIKLAKVSLHYEDPENNINEKEDMLFKPGADASKTWRVEIKDKSEKEYKWKASYFMTDGSDKKTVEVMTDEESLILELPV